MPGTIFPEGLTGTGPKYARLARMIRARIDSGAFGLGTKLPPVRELAWQLGITPGTVARAYASLTDTGLLTAEVGRGTYVADPSGLGPAAMPPSPWTQLDMGADTAKVSLIAPQLPDLGQVAEINAAFQRLGARPASHLLEYPNAAAFQPARRAVLRWLGDLSLGALDEQDIVLTHGGQSGISLVMQAVLKGRAPVILIEDLSYPGFRRAAQLLRADVVSVPMDDKGLIPQALEDLALQHDAQLLCTSPEVHNPTGRITPNDRRAEIADVARRRGFHVLEDDCYRLGRPVGPTYRSLLPDQGWHVSSLSKALTPALRIGFAIAPGRHRLDLRRAAEYGFFGLARPLADVAEDLLGRDETYALMDRLRHAVGEYVREAVNILGGYDVTWQPDIPFLWLHLPTGWRAGAFVRAAEDVGVQMRPAEDFALRDDAAPHCVRLAINGQVPLPVFSDALRRVRGLLDNPVESLAV